MHLDEQNPVVSISPRRNLLYRGSRHAQPLQISREAQKLSQMIDSWPTGGSFPNGKREIAADLLRGALGLQESLIKLGEIEETCKFMAQRGKKYDCRFTMEEEFTGEMDSTQAMGCRRFDSRSHQHGLRAVTNLRSSRTCLEEVKKVIRDSLYRQNLVSISSDDEKPSSSRSQKLPTGGDEDCRQKHETEISGSASAVAQQKKARAPNLIARLMGLEEAPPEEVRPVGRTERRRYSNRQRPLFDVEMPEVGKLPLMEGKHDQGREMLQETTAYMQFKGPLKSGNIENPQIGSPVEENVGGFSACDQVQTAVVIRPVHFASLEMEKDQIMEIGHASVQKNFQSPPLKSPKEVENRAGKSGAKAKKATKSDKTKLPTSSPHQKQLKEGTIRTRKKTKGTQTAVVDRSTSEEKKNKRSATASGSQIKKTSSTPRKPEKNPVQVKNRVLTWKNAMHREDHGSEKPASRNHVGIAKARKVMRTKPVKEPTPIIVKQADAPDFKQENKEVIPTQENGISPQSSVWPSDLLPNGSEHQCIANEGDVSACLTESERKDGKLMLSPAIGDTRNKSRFHCEVLPKRSHGGGNLSPSHAPSTQPKRETAAPVPTETTGHIKSLLLSSPSFLHLAEELFSLQHQQPTDCRSTETEKKVADNSKLLLDCAAELMSYKFYRLELASHPLGMSCLKSPATKISMNQVADEISGEIQELHYSGGADVAGACGDNLWTTLEKDVRCEGVWKKGAWEQGWSEAMPVEEADGVVCDMEKYIFEVLAEEIALDLLDPQNVRQVRLTRPHQHTGSSSSIVNLTKG